MFHDIGDLLEVKGELVFKTVAYHRAADAIGRYPVEVARAYREGRPPEIPGVGKAIADKLAGAGDDRPERVPREAARRVPDEPAGDAPASRASGPRPSG